MIVWVVFMLMIFVFLAIDLGVFNSKAHEISYKEATKWTTLWVSLALLFSIAVYFIYQNGWLGHKENTPSQAMIEYLTGYLVELSLSVDNIFVISMIFRSFKIPNKYQHRVLFWGILGALIFRGLMIGFGVFLIEKFTWMIYVFGGFLIFTALKMLFSKEEEEFDPKKSFIYRTLRKVFPITGLVHSQSFFIKKSGMLIATPLLLTLLLIEFTDILFALDSIPAILGITTDPFIVFTSNIFAILGLRSMYFFVANMLDSFHYLKYSLVVILLYVGVKMLLANTFHLPILLSLGIIIISLAGGILYSIHKRPKTAS